MLAFKENTQVHHSSASLPHKLLGTLANTLTNKESFLAYLEPFIQLIKPEWRYKQCAAEVISKRNENNRIYTLTLKPANNWQNFKAGQFIMLSVEINGRLLSRTFSISSSPRDFERTGYIQVSICEQEKGAVTPWLKANIARGDFVYLSPAMGEFCLNTQEKKLFIAGGSGFTPIRSMLKQSVNEKWFNDAHLFFYLRSKDDCCFEEGLTAFEKAGLQVHRFYSDQDGYFSQSHLHTALRLESQSEAAGFTDTEAYICGPGQMITVCRDILQEAGLSEPHIHFEYFGAAPAPAFNAIEAEQEQEEFIQVDYLDSGKQVKFSSGTVTKTLLELAEDQGLKPVSGCRMGICHQCICKKKQGRVFNTKTQVVSDSGPEDIQLCLSIPLGQVELEL